MQHQRCAPVTMEEIDLQLEWEGHNEVVEFNGGPSI